MAQPLPRVVRQPRGPNEYLAYLTRPEMAHLRSNPAAPHDERLPDKGPLNTFRGVPLFYAEGVGMGGYSDAVGDAMGNAGADAEEADWGHYMDSYEDQYGGIGNPGDDPRASEGGGEPQPAATGGTTVVPVDSTTNGTTNGGTDTQAGPTEAELLADRIADAMGAISGLFGNRQGVYDRLRDASYALSESGIGDAYTKAARRLNFQMLRQGLDTGQPDIDLRADLSTLKNNSLADAMRHAQGLSEALRQRDAAKRSSLMSQALSGNLMPGQVSGMAGTLSAGVPQSWGGIADIGWNIPSGYAGGGYGGFMPNWRSQDTGAYFGSIS
tara:strand:- start:11283 stop:12260 length:978 start_codon:yes stop_codon:yes gene_type:complete